MQIIVSPELAAHMRQVNKPNIIVEIAQCDHTDIEVTELHVHLISDKDVRFFIEKKRFRTIDIEEGYLLLPNYKLEYEDTLTFGLRKILFFKQVTYRGIKL